MTPTPEQQAIIKFALENEANLMVEALAGAAKTTTAEMICQAITDRPILFLAFNKRVADEAAKRLPPHVEVRTMNALGHRTWGSYTSRRLVLKTDKSREALKGLIQAEPTKTQGPLWAEMGELLTWISRAKRDGYVPLDWQGPSFPVMGREEWLDRYDESPSAYQEIFINRALSIGIADAYNGIIDFDDQIYMPTIFGGNWPRFPLVIVDEAQDLNPLQHEMLSRLVTRRLIMVGDPYQSIYAFRGAICNGMLQAKGRWDMETLPLSTTFRVPQAGVRRQWDRVPHMRWTESALEGHIEALATWSASAIAPEAAIICRNNAPLLSLGFRLLREGRAIKLVGFDIGAGLVRILRKLGPGEAAPMPLIEAWEQTEMRRAKRPATVVDRADCLRALCENRANLSAAISHAEALFKAEGPLQLMSIHKAKGLEFPVVYHLDPWRIPGKRVVLGTEEWEQEMNCKYVAETRFKSELYLVNLEDFA